MLDPSEVQVLLKSLESDIDADAMMALKSLKSVLAEQGVTLSALLAFAFSGLDEIKAKNVTLSAAAPEQTMDVRQVVQPQGLPECRVQGKGRLFISGDGSLKGETVVLTGGASDSADDIALGMKDAFAAAILNKTRFKIKLHDVKNARGEVTETILRAEYEQPNMAPVNIWSGLRGEAAVLANVLRTALKNQTPQLIQN